MISRSLFAAGLALLTGTLVSAQTSSLCNPLDTSKQSPGAARQDGPGPDVAATTTNAMHEVIYSS